METRKRLGASRGTALAASLCVLGATPSAQADQVGPYAGRSLTLDRGTVRIDAGPPDFGYFHPGGPHWINETRGLRVRIDTDADQEWVWLGIGAAYGITRELEVGANFPVRISPDGDIDDIEAYGRYRFVEGTFELGGQLTVQLPTETEFGLGVGLPMLVHATRDFRIDTGFEFEILFWEPDTVVNLDAPLALTWNLGRRGLLGMRTGLFLPNLDELYVPAGVHGGGVLADGHLDLVGWFLWPGFFRTDYDDSIDLKRFELGLGINGRID